MKFPLTQSNYQSLLDDIINIYENAQRESAFALNKIMVETYWKVGQRIVTVEQKNKIRAEYGAHLLERLSEDLTQKYPKGFSTRNLGKMRQFYLAYSISPTSAELDWSRYQLLSTIKDPEQRTAYERKTVKNKWTSRDLAAEIKKDKVTVETLPVQRLESAPAPTVKRDKPSRLLAQCGALGLAKIVEVTDIHGHKTTLAADVGFHQTAPLPPAQASGLNHGDLIILPSSRRGPYLQYTEPLKAGTRYTYQAFVLDVVDGDTLKVNIPLGPAGCAQPRLRLRGINCAEIDEDAGMAADAFVLARLKTARFIIIRTHSTDIYGRWISDVWYLPGEKDPGKVSAQGIYLNQELLDNGMAEVMG